MLVLGLFGCRISPRNQPFKRNAAPAYGRVKSMKKKQKAPRERSATIRQDIIELMKRDPMTPFEISGFLGISEREAAFHLEHALVSAVRNYRVEVTPAHCKACGYVFRDRNRVARPSRCPRCKAGRVEAAMYRLTGK
jgi:predicted Zn-ribbon and HTH transcriptional regulator